jgi:glycosyltransferase involved in cell wall biosynthesis
MVVNHVLSSDAYSSIFTAIFDYFREYAPAGTRVEVSVAPLPDADIHHYHRAHLEQGLSGSAVVTMHHDPADPDPWLAFEQFLPRYREARLVVCLNSGQQRFLAGYEIHHTVVIPHGYNHRILRARPRGPRAGREDGKVTLGLVSKFYERRVKGEAYLHDLVKRLSPRHFCFLLVGERRLVTAERLAALGYEVRVYEHLPYRLFQNLYESMDYLLMCSAFEGGPANIPEAMATCTPVLATPVGLAPDFIEDGVNGLILKRDPDIDAERITRLADPEDALTSAIEAGSRERATRISTWQDVVDRHFDAYRTHVAAEGKQ